MPTLLSTLPDDALLGASTAELQRSAVALRADYYPAPRITYSPKVFIPLTTLCRDQCSYCTFAQPPAKTAQLYLEPETVRLLAAAGAQAGCREALFTLGERPEQRYPVASQWLAQRGYDSTVDYLTAMCKLVVETVGLLPHVNAGALHPNELRQLRSVAASQGMMLESIRPDLACHSSAPDKAPTRRLATLNAAGEEQIPFTTGILVGIGDAEADRLAGLRAIAKMAEAYGHIQEVIVQNFVPKPGTGMHNSRAGTLDALHRAIALARIVLPPSVHVQAPPNLVDDPAGLIDSGVDDFGGISPVTIDHVNPRRPWPSISDLATRTAEMGFHLVPRLTIYPEYAAKPKKWLDDALRFPVLDHADATGYGRDDPGPYRLPMVEHSSDHVELAAADKVWFSGGSAPPPSLIADKIPPHPPTPEVAELLAHANQGADFTPAQLEILVTARGHDVGHVAAAADRLRSDASGDDVTFVANRNINYTNVCTYKCRFCGFSKGPHSLNLRGAPYLLSLSEVQNRVREAWESGATEVCLQGGIHPNFDGDYYLDVCRAVRQAAPDIHIHGFTALEVTEGARRSGVSLTSYLDELKKAGLRSLPGTAAEILDDTVRSQICPDKISTDEWLEAHETAHNVGLRSNVTMMFGTVEQPSAWARHFRVTRDLQKQTGGFTEFIGLPFVHMAAPIFLQRKARRGPTFRETILIHAVARIAYHGLIDNIQASWVKVGLAGVQQLLRAGCNDVGGTLTDENISRAAGASHGQHVSVKSLSEAAAGVGRTLRQRTTLYGSVSSLDR